MRFAWNIIRGIPRIKYREGPAPDPVPGPLGWNVIRGIPRITFGRGFPSIGAPVSAGSTLLPGTMTVIRIGRHSIALTATDATGGTTPYRYQWQYLWDRGGTQWIDATGQNVTTLSPVIMNLGPDASYHVRLRYTDAAGSVQYADVMTFYTRNLGWFPGLNRLNRRTRRTR